MCTSVMNDRNNAEGGFTLVELMIAMAVGGIVMAAVMTSFLSQHRSYMAQDDVVEMQQNARVAMDMLVHDIKSAGYEKYPEGMSSLGAGIITAAANNLVFTRVNAAGVLETIAYSLFDAYASPPASNDGVVDDLAREEDGGGRQVVAENISQLEFRYLDGDGDVTADLDAIRSIQVSMMVQTSRTDTNGPPAQTYTTPSGAVWTSTPGFRSRYLTTTVQCRNLGVVL